MLARVLKISGWSCVLFHHLHHLHPTVYPSDEAWKIYLLKKKKRIKSRDTQNKIAEGQDREQVKATVAMSI